MGKFEAIVLSIGALVIIYSGSLVYKIHQNADAAIERIQIEAVERIEEHITKLNSVGNGYELDASEFCSLGGLSAVETSDCNAAGLL